MNQLINREQLTFWQDIVVELEVETGLYPANISVENRFFICNLLPKKGSLLNRDGGRKPVYCKLNVKLENWFLT